VGGVPELFNNEMGRLVDAREWISWLKILISLTLLP
jgi:hypothetical protein